MQGKILLYTRLLIAAVILFLCGLAFWAKKYPIAVFDWQFTAALQSTLIYGLSIAALLLAILIVLTLLFGRIYCSTLCPLGLYQELLTVFFSPFYKKHKQQPAKHYKFAYLLAALSFGTLIGGSVVVLRLLDPYSISGNAMSGYWYGIGFVLFLTILVFFKKRFFCTNICPVGTILGFISRFSLFKIRIDSEKCKLCGLCSRACPCDAIDFKHMNVNNEICVKCYKCLGHCPHNSLFYGLPKTPKITFNPKRRYFVRNVLILALFATACRGGKILGRAITQKIKNVILPAGSNNMQDFANRCLNCNLCVQNCPMQIIKPATADIPFVHIDYDDMYCKYKCHKCSQVCPSGAIKHISLTEKQKTKIATAFINHEVCIKCGLCAQECPRKIIIKEKGMFPNLQSDLCIGCGKCAAACPVKAISIKPINKQIVIHKGEI